MWWRRYYFGFIMCWTFIGLSYLLSSCSDDEDSYELSQEQLTVLGTVPKYPIIAHRGTGEWAPEGTEAAMRWARNAGATYLECDIRRTKDGHLVVFHNNTLNNSTNIKSIFPSSKDQFVSDFTLEELFRLDLGSWFNANNWTHARSSFVNLDILTLEDVIKIAEGYRIKRDAQRKRIYTKTNGKITLQYEVDPADNGNRPGIYPETKSPEQYPGIERDIKNELERLGWYSNNICELKSIDVKAGKVATANTSARVIIQSLSAKSLGEFKNIFPRLIPLCLLINTGRNSIIDKKQYTEQIQSGIKNGAVIIAPSISGGKSDFKNLLAPWMHDLIKEKKMLIHAYTFYDKDQFYEFSDMVDGFFTGQVRLYKEILKSKFKLSSSNETIEKTEAQILDDLGY